MKDSQKSLKKWTKEEWGTKSGKPSAKTGERYLPKKAIDSLTKAEKLDRIKDMKFELERQTGRGTADLDQVEARMASINLAMSRVKNRQG